MTHFRNLKHNSPLDFLSEEKYIVTTLLRGQSAASPGVKEACRLLWLFDEERREVVRIMCLKDSLPLLLLSAKISILQGDTHTDAHARTQAVYQHWD